MATTHIYKNIKNSVIHQSTEALMGQLNTHVGRFRWASARSAHDTSIIDTLNESGVDVSAVYDGKNISFKEQMMLNEGLNKSFLVKLFKQ